MTTIRVQNIPGTTTDIRQLLHHLDCRPSLVVASSLEISHDDQTKKTATVTFKNEKEFKISLERDGTTMSLHSEKSKIAVDSDFLGLTVVSRKDDPKFDIIALHGLNGHAFNTWSTGSTMWLRDLLPHQVENSRIFVYGYNSKVIGDASTSRIQEHARLLVQSLQNFKREDDPPRRVIFVCHSLGGVVLKQALVYIMTMREYEGLRGIAYGVLFLGTPHRGSESAKIGRIIANIARVSFTQVATQLLDDLEKDAQFLGDLSDSFRTLHSQLKFATFFETLPMKLSVWRTPIVIVDRRSAVIGIDHETTTPLNSNHLTICKYTGQADEAYKHVVARLKNFANEIQELPLKATEEPLRGSTPSPVRTAERRSGISSKSNSTRPCHESDSETISPSIPVASSQSDTSNNYDYHIIFQIANNSRNSFSVIEKGLRSPDDDKWTHLSETEFELSLDHSGSSGCLLFQGSSPTELFSVAAGMHNYNPWCDILMDLPDVAKADGIIHSYYGTRSDSLWANLRELEKTSSRGTSVSLVISHSWDGKFIARVVILDANTTTLLGPERDSLPVLANSIAIIGLREQESEALRRFAIDLVNNYKSHGSLNSSELKKSKLIRFEGAIGDIAKYTRTVSEWHGVLQFFAQGEISKELEQLRVKLADYYYELTTTRVSNSHNDDAQTARERDNEMIDAYIQTIKGDVSRILPTLKLGTSRPQNDVISELARRDDRPADVGPTFHLLNDFIKWAEYDWFWLIFKAQSRDEIKAPLTRVIESVIPDVRGGLAEEDRIELTSGDLSAFQKVKKLFAVLDNSRNPKLIQLFYAALKRQNTFQDKLKQLDIAEL